MAAERAGAGRAPAVAEREEAQCDGRIEAPGRFVVARPARGGDIEMHAHARVVAAPGCARAYAYARAQPRSLRDSLYRELDNSPFGCRIWDDFSFYVLGFKQARDRVWTGDRVPR